MLRTLVFSGLLAVSLAGVAGAAEPGQPLVNRSDAVDVFAGRNNVVGGSVRNPDGSVTYLAQNGHRSIDDGYNQVPVGAYEGN
jgi:hypothetical protein